jgi:predicted Zn-dependent peptidase
MTATSDKNSLDIQLPNGIRFVGERIERSQGVAIALRVGAGVKDDPPERLGLSHLVTDTLFKGTRRRNARQLSDAFDFYGIKHSEHAGTESTMIQLRFLPEHLDKALDLLREVLSEPSFPEKECETAKVRAIAEIKHLEDDPLSKVFVILRELYFGTKWGHSDLGREELLPQVSRADIVEHWRRRYISAGTLVAAAGRFDPDVLQRHLEKLFANTGTAPAVETPPPAPGQPQRQHVNKVSEQTQIALAFPAVARSDAQYFAAQTAVGVLSGGMSGRLFTEVREKRALVYSVCANASSLRGTGIVFVYAGTTTPRAAETLAVLKTELARLGKDLTAEEVERAKIGLKAHMLMDQESTGVRARELLDDVFYEGRIVPIAEVVEQINAVTVADAKQYWESHPFEPYALVTLGKEALKD